MEWRVYCRLCSTLCFSFFSFSALPPSQYHTARTSVQRQAAHRLSVPHRVQATKLRSCPSVVGEVHSEPKEDFIQQLKIKRQTCHSSSGSKPPSLTHKYPVSCVHQLHTEWVVPRSGAHPETEVCQSAVLHVMCISEPKASMLWKLAAPFGLWLLYRHYNESTGHVRWNQKRD